MQNTKKITHAIFDMDGLMFDNEMLYAMSFEKAIGPAFGLRLTQEDYLPFMGLNASDTAQLLFEKYGIPLSEWEHVCAVDSKWLDNHIEENGVIVKPGLLKLLQWLNNNGIPYTIASGSPRNNILRNLRKSSLESYFDLFKIVDGSMVINGKPNPEIFLKAAQLMGCNDSKNCIVFEDSFNGVTAAYNGGFPCIWIPDLENASHTPNLHYLAKLKSLDESINILSTLI